MKLILAVAAIDATPADVEFWAALAEFFENHSPCPSIAIGVEVQLITRDMVASVDPRFAVGPIPLGIVRNMGLEDLAQNWVWLLDSDVFVDPVLVVKLSLLLKRKPENAIVYVNSTDAPFNQVAERRKIVLSDLSAGVDYRKRIVGFAINSNLHRLSLVKTVRSLFSRRSIEIIFSNNQTFPLSYKYFRTDRGVGFDDRIGLENLFLAERLYSHVFYEINIENCLLHPGNSTGRLKDLEGIRASKHIPEIFFLVTGSRFFSTVFAWLYFLLRRIV